MERIGITTRAADFRNWLSGRGRRRVLLTRHGRPVVRLVLQNATA